MSHSSSDPKKYYESIGVSPDCSDEELKKAFNKATMLFHPDGPAGRKLQKLPEPEKSKKLAELNERCRKINEARDILLNPEKRKAYDSGMFDPNTGQPFDTSGMEGMSGSVFDFFGDIFGQRGGKSRKSKAEDCEVKIHISFSDSYNGKNKKFKVNRNKICKSCHGQGASDVKMCSPCGGKGKIHKRIQRGPFATIIEEICSSCKGLKSIKRGPLCSPCNGKGLINTPEIIDLTIEPGLETNTRYCFEGKGDEVADSDILTGDLIFHCTVASSEKIIFNKKTGKIFNKQTDSRADQVEVNFERIGNNLVTNIEVDLISFLKGGSSIIFLPDETRNLVTFPPLLDGSLSILVRGKGFNGGDLIVNYKIKKSESLFSIHPFKRTPVLNINCKLSELVEDVDDNVIVNKFEGVLRENKTIYREKTKSNEGASRGSRSTSFHDIFSSGGASFGFF
ncbi:Mitochondrial protein import protein mas5 [Cucumispora dikerogammari]|nr:Mitochondrial protein import protein mas5 [Cucumispora dikerogammari]